VARTPVSDDSARQYLGVILLPPHVGDANDTRIGVVEGDELVFRFTRDLFEQE
jgi:hypothetical protein